jgi:catechol 2,3-dioxygenase-like lactoylglutathione lyase family enzyme
MKLTGFYPVICSSRLRESRDFYTGLLGFEPTFEADWYVSLRRPGPLPYELALLDHDHPTLPEAYRVPVRGLLLTVAVEDVADPSGVLIDVITPIAPAAAYADQYVNP